jgi:surface antigen
MMKLFKNFPIFLVLTLPACTTFSTPHARGHYDFSNTQCVPYAREQSGIQLHGDAYSWWAQAPLNGYARGNVPMVGAVLVLKKTPTLSQGHLAVVKHIMTNRQIDVTHSNWGDGWNTRRIIYDDVLIEDASAANDWTLVRFWNHGHDCIGAPYPAYGFIYPKSAIVTP